MSRLAISGGEPLRKKPYQRYAVIGEEEKKRVADVLESGKLSGFIAQAGDFFLGGEQVKELEGLAADHFSVKNVVSVNSATAGLHVALAACGVGPADEVIVPPYTMCASATAVVMQNAVPVFADITEEDYCIDPDQIRKLITPRTKAIVVVHLFGHPADMDRIMDIAREHSIKVVEDCAQAPGAVYKGRLAGTIADIGVFSLNQHKTITSGEGGFVTTDDDELALKMRLIRNHGEVIVEKMDPGSIENIVGYNYRMTELEAAVSIGQFKRLDILNFHRIELAEYFRERLSSIEGLTLPVKRDDIKHVYFVFPIRFNKDVVGVSRDVFVKALNAEGIPFGAGYVRPIYLEPMYQQKKAYGGSGCPFKCPLYKGDISYDKGICPVTERMHYDELMLTPICKYPHTREDIDDAVDAIEKVLNGLGELKDIQAD